MFKFFKWFLGIVMLLLALLGGFIYFANWYPAEVQAEKIYSKGKAPVLRVGQPFKVLSWNIQYLAGKDFVFFYDDGAEVAKKVATRPTPQAIAQTLVEVAKVIVQEDPDLILLQEVDDGAARTDHQDQLEALLLLLPDEYKCHSSAFYWKSAFVPDPNVLGSVGMKLSIISKYQLKTATRHALPLISYPNLPFNRSLYEWVKRQFYIKRAIQEVAMPLEGGGELLIFNTHFSAFAQGSNTMEKQVKKAEQLLEGAENKAKPWIFAGDLNLLPTSKAYQQLAPIHQGLYQEKTELEPLLKKYPSFPAPEQVDTTQTGAFFTHFPNDPRAKAPDRTIDYIFYSPRLTMLKAYVRQEGTLKISDHLPLIGEFLVEKEK